MEFNDSVIGVKYKLKNLIFKRQERMNKGGKEWSWFTTNKKNQEI
jgi:hypothetical protein